MAHLKYSISKVVVFICVMAIGYCVLFFSAQKIEHLSSCAIYPALRTQQVLVDVVQNWIRDRRDTAYLKRLLYETHQECQALRAENVQLQATRKYSEDIKELDAFKKQYMVDDAQIVQIIFRHFSDKEHYFLVDAGLDKGIKQDTVVVYKNCLIGKIEHVYPWYSKVRLITDASCKVAAYCAATQVNGIYQGSNQHDSALLQYVSHFKPVQLNDLVLSSGEGIIFPQGFSLGTVESCQPNALYHAIRIKPHIDLQSLSYCVLLVR